MDIILDSVDLRDGLQNATRQLSTDDKVRVALLDILSDKRDPRDQARDPRFIELGGFVSSNGMTEAMRRICKNTSDTALVLRKIGQQMGPALSAYVPSTRYARIAYDAGFRHLSLGVSANEEHQSQNTGGRITIDGMIGKINVLRTELPDVGFWIYLQTAFGFERPGDVDPGKLEEIVHHFVDAQGVAPLRAIMVGDTYAHATPNTYSTVMPRILGAADSIEVAVHIHQADPVIWQRLIAMSVEELGIRRIHTTYGGMGGCPINVAQGNTPKIDAALFLESRGHSTHLDLDKQVSAHNIYAATLCPDRMIWENHANKIH